jgi:hypothetical protein
MAPDDVTMLARAVGQIETQVEAHSKAMAISLAGLETSVGRRLDAMKTHLDQMCGSLQSMEKRHTENDALYAKSRWREEWMADRRARRQEHVKSAARVFEHSAVRAIVAALAAGAGFGIIAELLR